MELRKDNNLFCLIHKDIRVCSQYALAFYLLFKILLKVTILHKDPLNENPSEINNFNQIIKNMFE